MRTRISGNKAKSSLSLKYGLFLKDCSLKRGGARERGSLQAHKEGVPVPFMFGDLAPTAFGESSCKFGRGPHLLFENIRPS